MLLLDRDTNGDIQDATHIRADLWEFDEVGSVVVGNAVLDPAKYVLIKGPHDGLLNCGRRTLRGAINLELAWQRVVRNPIPTTVLQQVGDDQLTDDEIDALLLTWRKARQDPDGAVAYVPSTLAVQAIGQTAADVLTEARNATAIDIARLIGVPAVSLDAGPVMTSLTYQNVESAVTTSLPVFGLAPYANAIGYALSLDSVAGAGYRISLDMSHLLVDANAIPKADTVVPPSEA